MKAFIGILLAPLFLCSAVSAQAAQPRLEVLQAGYDFGKVFQGQIVEHGFVFTNAGDAPLEIQKVKSSCGCTAALVSEQTIAAGKTGEVKASFNSTNFSGAVQKKIYLQTNDPVTPTKEFVLYGQVEPMLAAEPPEVILTNMEPGSSAERTIRLVNRGSETLRIDPVQATLPAFVVSASETQLKPGKSLELTLKVTPDQNAQNFSGFLLVQARSEQLFTLRIPVQGRLRTGDGPPQ